MIVVADRWRYGAAESPGDWGRWHIDHMGSPRDTVAALAELNILAARPGQVPPRWLARDADSCAVD